MHDTQKKSTKPLIQRLCLLAVLIGAPFALYAALNSQQELLAYGLFALIAAAMLFLILK